MVDTVNDPEELAEEEGGSGMPMTDAAEIVAEDGDDEDDLEDDFDPEDDETDEEAIDEAAA